MKNKITSIVIVGGGTAGWLTAGIIAAEHNSNQTNGLKVTLIESPQVSTIGVGEGTWPTMRNTLDKIGISETEFIQCCDVSFKQGSQFVNWRHSSLDKVDKYYHPFVAPEGYDKGNIVAHWYNLSQQHSNTSFAHTYSYQAHLCDNNKAPKQIQTPEYAAVANYAYHLNATKFANLLKQHCINKLGVNHISDHIVNINNSENGDIQSVTTKTHESIEGDFFIDCSGASSLLIGQHYKIPFICKKDILFNDSALAVQVPYKDENDEISSHTISTAQSAGWIWDIGLPSRRGVGYTYSSRYINDADAEVELKNYLTQIHSKAFADEASIRKLNFTPGHREKFWHKNCVAVGMAAGFIEPLEASALALVELSAAMIRDELPSDKSILPIIEKRFNNRFNYRWDRIVDFLKLHYVLSQRTDSDYWLDNRDDKTIPDNLQELLTLWQHQPPSHNDFIQIEEIFPAASYQYILYGMGFHTHPRITEKQNNNIDNVETNLHNSNTLTVKMLNGLPTNRQLLKQIQQYGLTSK